MNATEIMTAIEQLPVWEQEEILTWLARKTIARHELKTGFRNGKYPSTGESGGPELRENPESLAFPAKS